MKQLASPLLTLGVVLVGCGAEEPGPPNVLWICIDTLRADHLGCYGAAQDTSPNLDALAAEGVLFRHAFSQAPWTKPSVPSFFTARFPAEHRVYEGSSKDHEGRVTSDVLDAGFRTTAEWLEDQGYRTAGLVHNAHLKPFLGMAQGFEHYQEGNRDAAQINASFWDWLGTDDAPFFAYLHYLDVHWPYRPAARHRERFPAPTPNLDLSGEDAGSLRDQINHGGVVPEPADLQAMVSLYDACIHQTDAALGDLFARLRQRGLWENTYVVVSSDHGEEFYEHGKIGHGHSLRDSLLHVPLILRGPGLPAGREVGQVAQSVDLLPTLLELLGLTATEVSGVSLVHAITGTEDGEEPRPAFAEVLHGRTYQRSVRHLGFKLIETYRWQGSSPGAGASESPAGLRPGLRVEVKGQFQGDEFEAEELSLEDSPDQDAEIRGPARRIDASRGRFHIGDLRVDAGAVAITRRSDGAVLTLAEVPEGAVLDVDGDLDLNGRIEADDVEWRDDKDGDTIKLEGIIERVDPGRRELVLLGRTVQLEDEVEVPGWSRHTHRTADDLQPERLADPEVFTREVELYDLTADPEERADVAADHADVVESLARRLADWAEQRRPPAGSGDSVTLDAETIEELRRIGYVE